MEVCWGRRGAGLIGLVGWGVYCGRANGRWDVVEVFVGA